MFEEDFERCFICQQPCKGLYCSSECRMQDKGTPSPALKAGVTPVRLTAQLPPSLSPLVRPVHHISPSPKMPGVSADTSSNSSITSSPLHSPRTNPSADDSPQNQVFNLPPPAFPTPSSLAFPGSMPVKIPALAPRNSVPQAAPPSQTPASHGSTIYPTGTSIDTLRFGRKPSITNSVVSPNALLPRCACGKPANHRSRASSKDRLEAIVGDSGFSRLNLGPSVLHTAPAPAPTGDKRIVSDSILPHPMGITIDSRRTQSGHTTPAPLGTGSLLSRSRSDPIPPSPSHRHSVIAPMITREVSVISPTRRASAVDGRSSGAYAATAAAMSRTGSTNSNAASSTTRASDQPQGQAQLALDMGRGRSKERIVHPPVDTSVGILNHPPEREVAPSRSRHRREERAERRRSVEREVEGERSSDREPGSERGRGREVQIERPSSGREGREAMINDQALAHVHVGATLPPAQPPQIMPSWSRRPEGQVPEIISKRLAQAHAQAHQQGKRSPRSPVSPVREREEDEKVEERRRARRELGAVFGVAAG